MANTENASSVGVPNSVIDLSPALNPLIGMVAYFYASPPLWLPLNGQTVAVADYPGLASVASGLVVGSDIVLPDVNGATVPGSGGRFIRGLGDRTSGDVSDDTTAVNGLTVVNNGDHQHSVTYLLPRQNGRAGTRSNIVSKETRDGRTVDTTVSGDHTHPLTGDAETAPASIALVACIFAGA